MWYLGHSLGVAKLPNREVVTLHTQTRNAITPTTQYLISLDKAI